MLVLSSTLPKQRNPMPTPLRRLRLTLATLVAEDRPDFKRIDVSPARYDDGSWLEPRRR
jgi:hypothetical protein